MTADVSDTVLTASTETGAAIKCPCGTVPRCSTGDPTCSHEWMMLYEDFKDSLDDMVCPEGIHPCLQALWFDATGDWHRAHEIVQERHDVIAARIHAYLHRKEGDDWNSRYWHGRAGSVYPEGMTLEEEWQMLVRELIAVR